MSIPDVSGLTAAIEECGKTPSGFTAADAKAAEKTPRVSLSEERNTTATSLPMGGLCVGTK